MNLLINSNTPFIKVQFEENGDIIGKIDYNLSTNHISLWNFWIYEKFRNKGYGYQAIIEIKKYLKGNKLWLYVHKDNTIAIRLYEKVGFKIDKEKYSNTKFAEYEMICDNF